ncbi:MAG: DUF2306 domain-containing protein [Bacteroidota bacterium]
MNKKIYQFILALLAIMIGLYPIIYLFLDSSVGFLSSKGSELLESNLWRGAFYLHILFGGISLLCGWSQFFPRWRNRHLKFHRNLGKIYLGSVTFSGIGGLYMAFFANGGLISTFGFGSLAMFWLITTWKAFFEISAGRVDSHQVWMMRSYALTFAAVTLRIWLPLFTGPMGIEFIQAYKAISWLCWVPNLILIEILIVKIQSNTKVAIR